MANGNLDNVISSHLGLKNIKVEEKNDLLWFFEHYKRGRKDPYVYYATGSEFDFLSCEWYLYLKENCTNPQNTQQSSEGQNNTGDDISQIKALAFYGINDNSKINLEILKDFKNLHYLTFVQCDEEFVKKVLETLHHEELKEIKIRYLNISNIQVNQLEEILKNLPNSIECLNLSNFKVGKDKYLKISELFDILKDKIEDNRIMLKGLAFQANGLKYSDLVEDGETEKIISHLNKFLYLNFSDNEGFVKEDTEELKVLEKLNKNLKVLKLRNVGLTKSNHTKFLGTLTNLCVLDLSENKQMYKSVVDGIKKLKVLKVLILENVYNLRENDLSFLGKQENFKNLVYLNLLESNLKDFNFINELKGLQLFKVTLRQKEAELQISGLKKLEKIYIDRNNLGRTDCKSISINGLEKLTYLKISNHLVQSLKVSECEKLENIEFENAQLVNLNLAKLKSLTKLEYAIRNRRGSLEEVVINNLQNLEELNLFGNKIRQITLTDLGKLKTLELSSNEIDKDQLKKILSNAPNIFSLHIYANPVCLNEFLEILNNLKNNNVELKNLEELSIDVQNEINLKQIFGQNSKIKKLYFYKKEVEPNEETDNQEEIIKINLKNVTDFQVCYDCSNVYIKSKFQQNTIKIDKDLPRGLYFKVKFDNEINYFMVFRETSGTFELTNIKNLNNLTLRAIPFDYKFILPKEVFNVKNLDLSDVNIEINGTNKTITVNDKNDKVEKLILVALDLDNLSLNVSNVKNAHIYFCKFKSLKHKQSDNIKANIILKNPENSKN